MLIFLAATTTFTRQHTLKITLPQATVEAQAFQGIELSIHESGRYALNGTLLNNPDLASLTQALRQAGQGQQEPAVLIRAAANASHQLVITAMQAARQAAIVKVYFATQAGD
jgi:biopolymer transport protein ExbD